MSSFHLAAILNFAVSWCEAWNPLLGMGVRKIRSLPEYILAAPKILGFIPHTSWPMKTNMNIVVKSNVRALKGLGVSPRVFQTSQICDTHAYFHHLITCANQKHIGSGNTRFFCFTCYAFKQQKQCLWCIITSSRGFFLWEKPWGREERIAWQRRNIHVEFVMG